MISNQLKSAYITTLTGVGTPRGHRVTEPPALVASSKGTTKNPLSVSILNT